MKEIRLARLIGSQVKKRDGKSIGKVVDLVLDPRGQYQVVGVEVGEAGWERRLNVTRFGSAGKPSADRRRIAWDDLTFNDDDELTLRDS